MAFFRYKLLTCLIILALPAFGISQIVPNSVSSFIADKSEKGVSLKLSDYHCDEKWQICFYYFQQYHEDIPIHGMISSVTKDDQEKILVSEQTVYYKEPQGKLKSNYSDEDIVRSILKEFDLKKTDINLRPLKSSSIRRAYYDSQISDEDIIIEEVYVHSNGILLYTHQVSIFISELNEWWQLRLDPQTDEVIDKNTWTLECSFIHAGSSDCEQHEVQQQQQQHLFDQMPADSSYLVFGAPLAHPNEGGRLEVIRPWSTGQAIEPSPFGWHDLDGIHGPETTITTGNNTEAYPDKDANNLPDSDGIPDGGIALAFHPPMSLSDEPQAYQEAAVTNLFYWNNLIHDIMYGYGFDEAAGNFQANNYGRGGIAGDHVFAEAQDGSGLNNANFSTPPDGGNPRMQMFEWSTSGSALLTINGNQTYNTTRASFGPTEANVSGQMIITLPNEACDPIQNNVVLNNNIAVIDRGNCKFVEKVLHAQNAGAIGVIICNNQESTFAMAGDTTAQITIPSVMITQSDCEEIKLLIAQSTTQGSLQINTIPNRDSDLDNGVIIHEYGHGISIRLTGGAGTSSCLSNAEQMGEGWSDFFGLLLTMKVGESGTDRRGMATYLLNQDNDAKGIRNFPYTTDLSHNPFTYADISSVSVPHGVGSIWATMLWDMTWGLIDEYGFDPNLYNGSGGNNRALQLVLTALKMQPCSPGFVDGRDAILAADQMLYQGANQCLIWNSFANRGLGYSADQGSNTSVSDGVESYDLPPICNNVLSIEKQSDQSMVTIGDTIHYTLTINNNFPGSTMGLTVLDTLSESLSLITNSLSLGSYNNGIISFEATTSDSGSQYVIEYDAMVVSAIGSEAEHIENFETDISWSVDTIEGSEMWRTNEANPQAGTKSIFVPNEGTVQVQSLSKQLYIPANGHLTFWHSFNTESRWDGGIVELSEDFGQSWLDLSTYFIEGGYNQAIYNSPNVPLANRMAFSGNSEGYQLSVLDLSQFAGKEVQIRFIFGSDQSVSRDGWYIDNITLYHAVDLFNIGHLTATGHDQINSITKGLILPNCIECEALYDCPNERTGLSVFDKISYRASERILTDGSILTGNDLILRAGDHVQLNPLFTVPLGSKLIIEMEDCNPD